MITTPKFFGGDENRESLERFADIFPINVSNWSYGGRGEGVTFSFTDENNLEELKGQRLATYLWNNYKRDLFEGKYYKSWRSTNRVKHPKVKSTLKSKETGWSDKKQWGEYWNVYRGLTLENSCVLTGYCADDAILAPVYAFLDKPTDDTFEELLSTCFDAWIKFCNADVENQNSDEYIADHLEANNYEFYEDGTKY